MTAPFDLERRIRQADDRHRETLAATDAAAQTMRVLMRQLRAEDEPRWRVMCAELEGKSRE